jgi:hypothetical protein
MTPAKLAAHQANGFWPLGASALRAGCYARWTVQMPECRLGGAEKKIFFGVPWNVVDNKGPKLRKMGQMRLPWNVYENTAFNLIYPGMLLINMAVSSF